MKVSITFFAAMTLLSAAMQAPGQNILTGEWIGQNRASQYLKLTQANASVTGVICEEKDKGCNDIQDGTFTGGVLKFRYMVNGQPHPVSVALTPRNGFRELGGTAEVSAIGISYPLVFRRVR